MNIIRLLTCDSPVEANVIKGKLESQGVDCFLAHENFASMLPNYSRILGSGVQVMIRESDLQKSTDILVNQNAIHLCCPDCGSTNTKTGLAKLSFKKIVAVAFSLLIAVPFSNIKGVTICNDCGAEY